MDLKDIYWVAGLLEGEGYFAASNAPYTRVNGERVSRKTACPVITLTMSDKDVIEKFGYLVKKSVNGPYQPKKPDGTNGKQVWTVSLRGKKALEWMQTIYVLMGKRRQEKIESVIKEVCHRP